MGVPVELNGQRFDKLLVVGVSERTKSGTKWLCLCECGNQTVKLTTQLRRLRNDDHTGCKSCESISRSQSSSLTTHGGCRRGKTKLYGIWKSMRQRCTNPNDKGWKYYGGKGIRVCSEWDSFIAFRDWASAAGYEIGLTIDRLNPNAGYEPGNCEFVTRSENSKRMIEYHRSQKIG